MADDGHVTGDVENAERRGPHTKVEEGEYRRNRYSD